MNSFNTQNSTSGSPQSIFSAKTTKNHAGVGQDKHAQSALHMASSQPVTPETPAYGRTSEKHGRSLAYAPVHTPKRHGSQKRRLTQVYGCVPPEITQSLNDMRDQGTSNGQKLSMSSVVAALLIQGVQGHNDMQYGALLEPTLKQTLHAENQARDARFASLLVKIAIDINQTKGIVYNLLARQPDMTEQTLNHILTESRKSAIYNLKDRSPEILELIAEAREWMEEDKNATRR